MGTGIVSILLHNLPYNAQWLQYVSYAFFGFNLLLFSVFSVISALRYTLYPEIWGVLIAHPAQSLFLGCFPMALASMFFFPFCHRISLYLNYVYILHHGLVSACSNQK